MSEHRCIYTHPSYVHVKQHTDVSLSPFFFLSAGLRGRGATRRLSLSLSLYEVRGKGSVQALPPREGSRTCGSWQVSTSAPRDFPRRARLYSLQRANVQSPTAACKYEQQQKSLNIPSSQSKVLAYRRLSLFFRAGCEARARFSQNGYETSLSLSLPPSLSLHRCVYIYIHIYIYMQQNPSKHACTLCIHTYLYICMERERMQETERESERGRARQRALHVYSVIVAAVKL